MFITFEGGEGSGKSTHARRLAERLVQFGREVVLTREPGGSAFGAVARDILLHHAVPPDAEPFRLDETAELLVFAADRAQHIDELIRPALERGAVVICDRFADSTMAYQGYGRGMPLDQVQQSVALATRGLKPDLTVLLNVPPEIGMARRLGERAPDQFEREALAFHTRVSEGFRALAAADRQRFVVIDATAGRSEVAEAVWEAVAPRLAPS